ncbi:unnamed protein product [Citrullus colocynthis]|uniref:Secreted protein n=1 Tax=Citrullus colocynthis TaxID=252529 RepID=A0ABP0Z993_9ROSI
MNLVIQSPTGVRRPSIRCSLIVLSAMGLHGFSSAGLAGLESCRPPSLFSQWNSVSPSFCSGVSLAVQVVVPTSFGGRECSVVGSPVCRFVNGVQRLGLQG